LEKLSGIKNVDVGLVVGGGMAGKRLEHKIGGKLGRVVLAP